MQFTYKQVIGEEDLSQEQVSFLAKGCSRCSGRGYLDVTTVVPYGNSYVPMPGTKDCLCVADGLMEMEEKMEEAQHDWYWEECENRDGAVVMYLLFDENGDKLGVVSYMHDHEEAAESQRDKWGTTALYNDSPSENVGWYDDEEEAKRELIEHLW